MTRSSDTWLVTGASGFLGTNFGAANDRDSLIGLSRTDVSPRGYSTHIHADLLDENAIADVMESMRPTYVVHSAALASHEECERDPDLAYASNVTATATLAHAAHRVGSRFIYISTDAVFDGMTGNYSETDTPRPFSVYGATKHQGEKAALEVNPDTLIIRTNFFGWSPTGNRSILELFVNNLRAGNSINGYTDFTVTSGYVQDLIRVIHQVKDQTGTWHITSADALSKFQFGREVADVFGFDADLITPVTGHGEISRSRDISLNTTKVNEFLQRRGSVGLLTQRAGIERARQDQ
ncbi:MAG: SDR family oxidoreductase [Candidatus Nanopelagicales bacterium]|nr:SDR family oxidoreductase [Candidatus Nanopelagicales bacterium]